MILNREVLHKDLRTEFMGRNYVKYGLQYYYYLRDDIGAQSF